MGGSKHVFWGIDDQRALIKDMMIGYDKQSLVNFFVIECLTAFTQTDLSCEFAMHEWS